MAIAPIESTYWGMTDHEIFKYWMLLKQTKHELTTITRITVVVKILS